MTDAPNVEYFEDEAGEHRFRIKAGNGEIVHTSEGYTRARDAERGFRDMARIIRAIDRSGGIPASDD